MLNIGRIWVPNCPSLMTCPSGPEVLQGKWFQIQSLIPFKFPFTSMEVFPIRLFKIHKIETKSCAQSVFAANKEIHSLQKKPVPFDRVKWFSTLYLYQNIFKNLLWTQPTYPYSALRNSLWSPGSTGINRTTPIDVNWS